MTVLLFVVGLKLDPDALRAWRAPVLLAALAQVAVCAGAGFATAWLLGLDPLASAYVGAVVALSSTVVGVKLLWNAGELSSAHGRLALGFLLVQDVAAVAAMAVFFAPGHVPASPEALVLLAALVSLPLLAARRHHLPAVAVLRPGEIVLVGALGWAALVAAVSEAAGLGKELGGLAAALSLALTPYREALAARLGSVRDFLCLCLFVGLGAAIVPAQLAGALPGALALAGVRWLVIAIPVPRTARTHPDPRHVLIGAARAAGFAGQVAVVVRDPADAPALRALGADVVLQPAVAAAPQAARALMGLVLTHPR